MKYKIPEYINLSDTSFYTVVSGLDYDYLYVNEKAEIKIKDLTVSDIFLYYEDIIKGELCYKNDGINCYIYENETEKKDILFLSLEEIIPGENMSLGTQDNYFYRIYSNHLSLYNDSDVEDSAELVVTTKNSSGKKSVIISGGYIYFQPSSSGSYVANLVADSSGTLEFNVTSGNDKKIVTNSPQVVPKENNTTSLGTSSLRWKEGYFESFSLCTTYSSSIRKITANITERTEGNIDITELKLLGNRSYSSYLTISYRGNYSIRFTGYYNGSGSSPVEKVYVEFTEDSVYVKGDVSGEIGTNGISDYSLGKSFNKWKKGWFKDLYAEGDVWFGELTNVSNGDGLATIKSIGRNFEFTRNNDNSQFYVELPVGVCVEAVIVCFGRLVCSESNPSTATTLTLSQSTSSRSFENNFYNGASANGVYTLLNKSPDGNVVIDQISPYDGIIPIGSSTN